MSRLANNIISHSDRIGNKAIRVFLDNNLERLHEISRPYILLVPGNNKKIAWKKDCRF